MPYRIIKKVKLAVERPLVRSSDYAMNFGVDLDDEKTWKLYPLYRSPRPRILGEVSHLLDENGDIKYVINEDFEFDIYVSAGYGGTGEIIETRFMYLPRDLVRGYDVDEGMAIDLLLREVVRGEEREELFPKILKIGPMDVALKDYKDTALPSSDLLVTTELTDTYYSKLVFEINRAFGYGLYTATLVLVRKLFENLIVDLLRTRYGMRRIDLFYWKERHMHHSLSTLISNLRDNAEDFKIYTDAFNKDKNFFRFLDEMKEQADAGAHSLEILPDPDKINVWKPSMDKYIELILWVIQKSRIRQHRNLVEIIESINDT